MTMMKKTVVLVGDSIRMGYQATVREELVELAWIRSAAENGGPSPRVVEHIDDWIVAHKPDVVHMNAGLHDIARERDADDCRVSLEQYEANLRTLFSRLRAETDAVLIWATTTPVIEEKHNSVKPFDRLNADIDAYNAAAVAIAAEYDVEINDLNALVAGQKADSDLMTPDGVHYTPKGSHLLGQVVASRICPHL